MRGKIVAILYDRGALDLQQKRDHKAQKDIFHEGEGGVKSYRRGGDDACEHADGEE